METARLGQARLMAFFCILTLTTSLGRLRAADVSHYRLLKAQHNTQTNASLPTPSPLRFTFWAQVWQSDSNSVASAFVTTPNLSNIPVYNYNLRYPWVRFLSYAYPTQSSLDASQPAGDYRFTFATLHDGTTNLTLSLPAGDYPPAPHINNQPALQAVDPSLDCTVSWDAFNGATASDFIELQILNSTGTVHTTGLYLGAAGALDGLATSATIPANTLRPGRGYVGRLAFMRITGSDYTYAPGFAAFVQYTDFYLATTGAIPPVVVSAVPSWGVSNVPGNAKVVFTFNKPMSSGYSYRVLGAAGITSRTWSADQMTLTLASTSPWSPNSTKSWYLNYFGGFLSFCDTEGSPVMSETPATSFTVGTNLLPATPLSPRLEIPRPPSPGAVQIYLTDGEAYRSYQFQASGDLLTWFPLSTVTATNSSFMFTDPVPPATNWHYRVLALP